MTRPRTVPCPTPKDFGTRVPVLLVYDDDGAAVDAVFGADIQPYLDALAAPDEDDVQEVGDDGDS